MAKKTESAEATSWRKNLYLWNGQSNTPFSWKSRYEDIFCFAVQIFPSL